MVFECVLVREPQDEVGCRPVTSPFTTVKARFGQGLGGPASCGSLSCV